MNDTSNPHHANVLQTLIKSESELQAAAQQKAFDQAAYAQRIWWVAARNLELATGLLWDDLCSEDFSCLDLETLKKKGVRA